MPTFDFSHLSPQERIELIGDICESLDGEALPLSAEWKAELDRRNATFSDDRAYAIPWSEVRAKLRPGRS
ncbi:addiction module component, tigr02574 family protein [Paramagnetospirillum kuznetsovii]|jgi:putative addiction module component (TIGR02574 family)|uniref:Addiction module component, tigr02574 family protein n=1 Tax=Paramagnetospirillum kuznetsovii TaxID=2053833 RepID=A0A364NUG5_9PROT|nr:addiction module protein [Paramagnetospirillum kuznetsovii]RAU20718.1 addiction module component, tigr02574 family protein [Paramagnetospirillum kuznetsovii]